VEMFQQFFIVLSVLGLLCGALWALKKKGWVRTGLRPNKGREHYLEVIDRLSLTPQHSLHLVRLQDRTLLIGLSPNGCNLLESARAITATSPGND